MHNQNVQSTGKVFLLYNEESMYYAGTRQQNGDVKGFLWSFIN
jgi:hypothetical protein